MANLRRITTRHLILLCAALLAAVAAGTALALAAGSGGAKPPPRPLAAAVHDALAAPSPQGVTARIQFTNHLLDSATLEGSDPILSGASGRLWATSDGKFRLELQSSNGADAQVVSDGKTFWVYDGSSNTVYRGAVPQHRDGGRSGAREQVPTLTQVQQALGRLRMHAVVSGAQPDNVGGQPAYNVRLSPKQGGGLLGGVALAWDAAHGVPLRADVYARGQQSPVFELAVTDISLGPVQANALNISPPAGAKTVDLGGGSGPDKGSRGAHAKPVTGLAAVRAAAPFHVAAPGSLAGRARQEVKLLGQGTHSTAIATYGQGLGGIAVIERSAPAASAKGGGHDAGPAKLNLPKVTVNGASGEELDTALGSVVRFERGGVSYTVLGSVKPAAALAAARGL